MPKDETRHPKLGVHASANPKQDNGDKDKPKKVLRACDACHHRRVRCNHDNPCDNCIRLNINCTWVKASKGKQASGRRIDLLRKGHNPAALDDFSPSPARFPVDMASTSAGSPGASRLSGHSTLAQSPRHLPPPISSISPSHMSATVPSPGGHMAPPNLYSRDAPLTPSTRTSYPSFSRFDPPPHSSAASSSTSFHHASSSPWPSSTLRSPSSRYPPHNTYSQSDYPPSSSHHPSHHYSTHSPYAHLPSHHGYSDHPSSHYQPLSQPRSQPSQHPQHQPLQQMHHPSAQPLHTSQASSNVATRYSLSSSATASNSALGFSSSKTLNDALDSSLSELAPDVAAGLRLPDFATSLADSYLDPNEGSERRRNVLLDMQTGALGGASGQVRMTAPGSSSSGAAPLHSDDPSNNLPNNGGGCDRQTFLDILGQSSQMLGGTTPSSVATSEADAYAASEPHPLADSVLIPNIALFFERLQSIMPVFTRAWIFGKIDRGEHRTDPQLGAMLIALSAFALTQPVDSADFVDSSSRKRRVRRLLEESVRLRCSALFGSRPSLEAIMGSFFIFGTLFGLGEENAAWFRLREAVTLGYLLRIHETSSYEHLDKDEQERRLRAYLLLAITERAYAIQSGSSITFRGNPRKATDSIRRKFDVTQLQDFPNLQSRLFDVVDEKFVDCWNKKCPGPGCDYLDAVRAVQLHRAIKESDEDEQLEKELFSRDGNHAGASGKRLGDNRSGSLHHPHAREPYAAHYPTKQEDDARAAEPGASNGQRHGGSGSGWDKAVVQKADVDVTRQWLLNRLWITCRSHGLLTADAAEAPLRIDYAIDIARETLRVCNSLSLRSMEAHGVGLTRKLNDIAQTLVIVCRDYPAIAMSVPFEGDPLKTDPMLFGPYMGPSPPALDPSASAFASAPVPPSASSASSQHHSPAPDSRPGSLGMVPLDKAFSPSYAIEAILHKYLDLFKRFRGGDHPYLPQLVEAVKELPKMAELSFDRFLREMGLF